MFLHQRQQMNDQVCRSTWQIWNVGLFFFFFLILWNSVLLMSDELKASISIPPWLGFQVPWACFISQTVPSVFLYTHCKQLFLKPCVPAKKDWRMSCSELYSAKFLSVLQGEWCGSVTLASSLCAAGNPRTGEMFGSLDASVPLWKLQSRRTWIKDPMLNLLNNLGGERPYKVT